jgi:LysM repeat protein
MPLPMPPTAEEHEPGVYVRNRHANNELDFLWNADRKRHNEHERFHLGFFAGGFLTGSLVTLAVCLFLFPQARTLPSVMPEKSPVIIDQTIPAKTMSAPTPTTVPLSPVVPEPSVTTPPAKSPFMLPFSSTKTATPLHVKPETEARLYEVQSGDTMGSIAIKFYDSSDPAYIEKIRRANTLSDADTLSLGQRLTIPPKTY